ncbi:MAG: sulfotransferase family protein [Halioglobus sp.]
MTLEVIGAGFGRTGTTSLQAALHQLGYAQCHHMRKVITNPKQVDYFLAAINGDTMNWDKVFEGFDASVDWPSSKYYKELADYYPEAKVILSVRDAEGCYKSTKDTIYTISQSFPWWMTTLIPRVRKTRDMVNSTVWNGVFDGRFEDKDHAIKVFEQNIEEGKRTIPEHRLLVHNAKEGWEPLCEFLNKPVPDTPYPRTNETAEMQKDVRKLKRLGLVPWVLAAAIIAFVLT